MRHFLSRWIVFLCAVCLATAGLTADVLASGGPCAFELGLAVDPAQKKAILAYIDHGCDLKKFSQPWSLLHWATFYGWTDVAGKLIERGVDIDLRTASGQTALRFPVAVIAQNLVAGLFTLDTCNGEIPIWCYLWCLHFSSLLLPTSMA